jgi:hypothetical protein
MQTSIVSLVAQGPLSGPAVLPTVEKSKVEELKSSKVGFQLFDCGSHYAALVTAVAVVPD